MTVDQNTLLRSIPSVASLLDHEEVVDWLGGLPRATVVGALQDAVDAIRMQMLDGQLTEPTDDQSVLALAEQIVAERSIPSLRGVINATGIVLHTGLGRAPLGEAALDAIIEGAAGYCNLEYELETGKRGRRNEHVAQRIAALTGAEAATVVNNNAAATYLILAALARDREVIVSRGQLVEIGGSYRLPDIMHESGAIMREVGTTNRTHLKDYERAINDRTAAVMRVHTSNYKVVGFTHSVPLAELVGLAHRYNLLAIDDLGSGAVFDLSIVGLPNEPNVRDSLADGANLVCFSGDKLLGGPQCGIIVGQRELIDQINAHALMRTYRVDKITLLALEATIRLYEDEEQAVEMIPTLNMLSTSTETLAQRATALAEALTAALPSERFLVCSDVGFAGGGSLPTAEVETVVVQWRPSNGAIDQTIRAMRDADDPVVARVRDDTICFDMRTIREGDFEALVATVSAAMWDEDDSDGYALPILS